MTNIKNAYNYLKYKGLVKTIQELADKVQMHKSTISSALNGDKRYLTEKFVLRFNQTFDYIFNEEWLLGGEGEMLAKKPIGINNIASVEPYIKEELIYLPLITTPAFASFVENLNTENKELDTYPIYRQKSENITNKTHVIIEVQGDSMYPTINNHSKVLCERIDASKWDNLQNEKVIAIIYDSTFTIKRIKRNNLAHKNSLILSSDNTRFGKLEINREDIRAIFKAIRKVSEDIF